MNAPDIAAPKPLTFSLLRLLADGEFHSGEVLARQLEVSRASVNNALQGIEQYGLTLFSVRGRGYRLIESPAWLDAERMRASLRTPEVFHIAILDTAASSNTSLLQRAAQGIPGGSVLALEWQSAGRGRLGRTWHSGLGNALTFSLLWRFESGISALSGLSLGVGVALMRALRKLDVTAAGLKWPNDVLNDQGKLAGILIEAQGDMLGPSLVVIGIGLNLRLPPSVAQRIDQPVSDLAQSMEALPERNRLLALLLQELADMLARFAAQGFAPLRAEWESYHVYQDRSVRMLLPDGSQVAGIVRGVTDEGALRVETQHGMQVFNAGEISLREA
jgi:BirA family biotin operon repressor/biotin-[acetyl-CoA-carboxylase] ligase